MSLSDLERTNELLLSIDTRLQMLGTQFKEFDNRLTSIENELRRHPLGARSASASANGDLTSCRSPEHMAREYAVLAALEAGPQTLTAIARVVYQREPEDRETQTVYRTLQRLARDGRVTCDRKRYALVEKREETRA